jgi:hypothetical protein
MPPPKVAEKPAANWVDVLRLVASRAPLIATDCTRYMQFTTEGWCLSWPSSTGFQPVCRSTVSKLASNGKLDLFLSSPGRFAMCMIRPRACPKFTRSLPAALARRGGADESRFSRPSLRYPFCFQVSHIDFRAAEFDFRLRLRITLTWILPSNSPSIRSTSRISPRLSGT